MNAEIQSVLETEDLACLMTYLESSGALRSGHFRLTSGLHSPNYMQCALLLMNPERSDWCGKKLSEIMADCQADLVLSPALGGVVIGQDLARHLQLDHLFAERKEGVMQLRRGFQIPPGSRFIAVEDAVTTGGSVREVITLAQQAGAELSAVAAIINRSGKENPFADLGVPFYPLLSANFPLYQPDSCPLCAAGKPIDTPGSRNFGQ